MATLKHMTRVIVGSITGICVYKGIHSKFVSESTCYSQVDDIKPTSRTKVSDLKLINVQVFFRHGARTPLRHLEGVEEPVYDENFLGAVVPHTNIPFKAINLTTGGVRPKSGSDQKRKKILFKGGMNAGCLTATGKDQMYLLGQRLKKIYIDDLGFIGPAYNTDDVYVRSTNMDRTVESLRCVVAGMFGVEHFQRNGPLIMPVMHLYHEMLFPNFLSCASLRHVDSNYKEWLMQDKFYSSVVAQVQEKIGNEPTDYLDMMMVRDHVVARKTHGLFVPGWLEDLLPELEKAATTGIKHFVSGDDNHRSIMMSLSAGPIYHLIKENMQKAIKDRNSTQKLHLYSAHDTTLFPLLLGLGDKFTDKWPPYAADIRYELYTDSHQKYWVKIHFCGKELIPNGCDSPLISYDEFCDIVEPVIVTPEQYAHRCSDIEIAREFAREFASSKEDKEIMTSPPMM